MAKEIFYIKRTFIDEQNHISLNCITDIFTDEIECKHKFEELLTIADDAIRERYDDMYTFSEVTDNIGYVRTDFIIPHCYKDMYEIKSAKIL